MLGDGIEFRALEIARADGRRLRARLPDDMVFEDLAPRLWDVDGDGAPEVIVVETAFDRGARLAVWGPHGRIAATPFIGQRHRWLAPLGAADLDGDGWVEIAYVETPHLGKRLRLWRLEKGMLVPVAALAGITNHRIGSEEIHGGVRDCGAGPELIAADGHWRNVVAIRFDGEGFAVRALGDWSADAARAVLACR